MNIPQIKEDAGPFGQKIAANVLEKIHEVVEGMPESSPEQRAAIYRIIAANLGELAESEEDAA